MSAIASFTLTGLIRVGYAVLCAQSLSRVRLFVTPWTVAHQASLSMEILQAKYWSGLPCPPPGDFPKPGIEPRPPALQVDSLPSVLPAKPMNAVVGKSESLSVMSDSL